VKASAPTAEVASAAFRPRCTRTFPKSCPKRRSASRRTPGSSGSPGIRMSWSPTPSTPGFDGPGACVAPAGEDSRSARPCGNTGILPKSREALRTASGLDIRPRSASRIRGPTDLLSVTLSDRCASSPSTAWFPMVRCRPSIWPADPKPGRTGLSCGNLAACVGVVWEALFAFGALTGGANIAASFPQQHSPDGW